MGERRPSASRSESSSRIRNAPTGSLRLALDIGPALIATKVALLLLVFYPLAPDTFGLAKAGVDHVTTLFLAAIVLFIVGSERRWRLFTTPLSLAVIALVLAFTVAAIFSLNQTVAIFGAPRRYLGLAHIVDGASLYFGVLVLLRSRRDMKRLLIVVLAASAAVAAYGLAQWTGHDFVTFLEGNGRPVSTLGQPDVLGGFLSVAVSAILSVLVLQWGSLSRAAKVALILAAAACGSLMYLIAVRDAVLGFAAGLAALAVMAALRGASSRRLLYAVFSIAVLGALLLAVTPLGARFRFDNLGTDLSLQSRLELWETAVNVTNDRPIFGLGPDNFVVAYPSARAQRSEILSPGELANSTHSLIFYVLTSSGIVGFASFVFVLFAGAATSARITRARHPAAVVIPPLAAYLAQGLVDVNDVGLDWTLWLALGVAAAATAEVTPAVVRFRHGPSPMLVMACLGLLLASVWSAASTKVLLDASAAVGAARSLASQGLGLPAVQYARVAISLDGGRAVPWAAFASALATVGNADASATAYLEAASKEPWDPTFWRDAAIEKISSGNERVGGELLGRAIQADPYDSRSLDLLARLAFNRGEFGRAAEYGERASRLDPNNAQVYEAPVQAYFELRRFGEARRLLLVALTHVESGHLHVLLARAYLVDGDRDHARAEAERALAIEPDNPDARELLKALDSR